jgi:hypothetical protein
MRERLRIVSRTVRMGEGGRMGAILTLLLVLAGTAAEWYAVRDTAQATGYPLTSVVAQHLGDQAGAAEAAASHAAEAAARQSAEEPGRTERSIGPSSDLTDACAAATQRATAPPGWEIHCVPAGFNTGVDGWTWPTDRTITIHPDTVGELEATIEHELTHAWCLFRGGDARGPSGTGHHPDGRPGCW